MANVAHSYQITLFARRHCFPRGVSRGLSKTAFEQPKIACWASGAPLGSRAPSWRPFLDFSGCISGLGGSLGYFLVAFGVSLAFFSNFLAHQWLIFCKNLRSNFVLHADVKLKLDVYLSFPFWFSRDLSLKKLGRPNFPEVVSSCYRAGNWEWVNMTHDRTKDPSPLKGNTLDH